MNLAPMGSGRAFLTSANFSQEAASLLLQHGAWPREPRKREVLELAEATETFVATAEVSNSSKGVISGVI